MVQQTGPLWVMLAAPVSTPVAAVGAVVSGIDHHNQIIGGDINENETVP